jgi:hypothetical protein
MPDNFTSLSTTRYIQHEDEAIRVGKDRLAELTAKIQAQEPNVRPPKHKAPEDRRKRRYNLNPGGERRRLAKTLRPARRPRV